MNNIHQIRTVNSDIQMHPNNWDELICDGDPIIVIDTIAYFINSSNNITRASLNYVARATNRRW